MAAPTPVSSLVHSSTLVTAGVYLFVRFFYLFNFYRGGFVLCVIRGITSLLAGFIAFLEVDLRKLVAISTLRQLGLIMYILSLGDVFLCYFHIVSHALFKALLFLRCGAVILSLGGLQDMRFMGGLSFLIKLSFSVIILSNLSLVGFPFLSGFFSKDIILEYRINREWYIFNFLILFLSCVLSVIYRVKIILIVVGMFNGCANTEEKFFI